MSSLTNKPENKPAASESKENPLKLPSISLPKGGGAIRGIGEKFAANPVTGTGSLSIPIFTSPGRSGFGPQLSLSYDSGSGNGPFGFGWSLSLPSITRKTDKGLPKYLDLEESDEFLLSGAEDLVPVFKRDKYGNLIREEGKLVLEKENREGYEVLRFRPRIEGLFAVIERWTRDGDTHWRSISKDNVLTVYGRDKNSRIYDPADEGRIFSWLICESYDDKGNAIVYEYVSENGYGIDLTQANERNRVRTSNRYLKRIKYGNRQPLLLDITKPNFRKVHTEQTDFSSADWMFELVFDYNEGNYPNDEGLYSIIPFDKTKPESEQHQLVHASATAKDKWSVRPDPFSVYRAGFEVRTYRRCYRVLMFHNFPELGKEPYLVRSTEFDYSDLNYSQPVEVETELKHEGSTRFASFIQKVTQSGYVYDETKQAYLKKSLPPLEFGYSQIDIKEEIKEIDVKSLENLPYGLDSTHYQWVDLDGEGVSGILTEQAEAWFYKPNLGGAKFGPIEKVPLKPSLAEISSGNQQLIDLAGDGQLDLVLFEGPVQGFYERTYEQGWEDFTSFTSIPNVLWKDPNLKFVDLNGDGHADILITENNVFTLYSSLAEKGFSPAERVYQALDEEKGPNLVFYDGSQSIYLADMSGDGLTDLARIRNGEVCYWPNLGYGRFGAKVTMDNAPRFDSFDQFDQKRIRLADVDGSGTTDIIYLKSSSVEIYFNRSGNSFSKVRKLSNFPHIDNLSSLQVADLFGNGTACLIWSSPLPSDSNRQMRYIDLMGGQKPHLLTKSKNDMGAETKVNYVASTYFYLVDKNKGKPWVTRIPFPVHVVKSVETCDRISKNRFITRYTYHHGYFDGIEREFRGFGRVEQLDTEEIGNVDFEETDTGSTNWDIASFVPPVLTRTWFHTGSCFEEGRVSKQFEDEYYCEGDPSRNEGKLDKKQLKAMLLPDTILPDHLTAEETREAYRSLKGSILRQEVYALDCRPDGAPSEESDRPYTVSERNYTIKCLQPQEDNKHSVFFVHSRETIDFHYERKLYDVEDSETTNHTQKRADPRVKHSIVLDVDDFGNVLQEVNISYGRRYDDPDKSLTEEDRKKQRPELNNRPLAITTYSENSYTNPIVDSNDPIKKRDAYRAPLPCEVRTYELLNLTPDANMSLVTNLFRFNEIFDKINGNKNNNIEGVRDGKHDIPYEDVNSQNLGNKPHRRIIEHQRILYRSNQLDRLLPLNTVDSLALPGEKYKLAFTSTLLESVYQRKTTPGQPYEKLLPDHSSVLGSKGPDGGGYVHFDVYENWWIPSGQIYYSLKDDIPNDELIFACKHFFLPHRFCDPFGKNTFVYYDSNYDSGGTNHSNNHNLLLKETKDALGNIVTSENDYRVLQPKLITDPNGNRSAAAFDALGMVVGTAVMGKNKEPDGKPKGDSLEGFVTDLTLSEIQAFVVNPRDTASALLNGATSRIIYDVNRYSRCSQPIFAATLAREKHQNDTRGDKPPIQISLTYSDGFGREIQTKIQAEKGDAPERGPDIKLPNDGLPNGDVKPGELVLENGNPKQKHTDHRWVGKGRTVYNNKGKPVKQYEPFFSSTHLFEEEKEMTDTGVTPVIFYDPVERVIATLHPNHTYEKVVFDPWHQKTYDVNDTVTGDPRKDANISGYVAEYFKQEAPDPNKWKTWLQQRNIDPLNPPQNTPGLDPEVKAAIRTLPHADTPTIAYFDTLGRTFLTIANNDKDENGKEKLYKTHTVLDIEGNQRQVIDAKDRIVMIYDYDMLSNKIHQSSMEAGERWILNNVANNPIRTWDSRGFERVMTYDPLQRPLELNVTDSDGKKFLAEKTEYGESKNDRKPEETNHKLKPWIVYDGAGILVNDSYDFKGNLLQSSRHLLSLSDCKGQVDWNFNPKPDEIFISSTVYDALNRPIQIIAPHSDKARTKFNVTQPVYNEANLLEGVNVWLEQEVLPDKLLDPNTATHQAVKNIDYNAKGQRELVEYGNGAETRYTYDKETFRLTHLYTRRGEIFKEDCAGDTPSSLSPSPEKPPEGKNCGLQNLHYTYDPVGNIVFIRDYAQQTIFFDGKMVRPDNEYTYDAIYRLVEAHGREHKGQAEIPHTSWNDTGRVNLEHPHDGTKMCNYFEHYMYDEVGNIQSIDHKGDAVNWIREYQYNETSQIETNKQNNRLTLTTVGGLTEHYGYDFHGNMISMPHFNQNVPEPMAWDFEDQLQSVDKGNGCSVYYTYDAGGQRVRKIIENDGKNIRERIYIGGFEVYREYNGSNNDPVLERESLQIMDDKQRIALVETRTIDTKNSDKAPRQLIRYQFSNHLGSASLELNDQAQVISYEEYYPYGSTSYQAVNNEIKPAAKRYRYTGKERDEESGLYYHGMRYYAPWLGRWTSCDPAELIDGINTLAYVLNNPVKYFDVKGLEADEPIKTTARNPVANRVSGVEFEKEYKSLLTRVGQKLREGISRVIKSGKGGSVNDILTKDRSHETKVIDIGRDNYRNKQGELRKPRVSRFFRRAARQAVKHEKHLAEAGIKNTTGNPLKETIVAKVRGAASQSEVAEVRAIGRKAAGEFGIKVGVIGENELAAKLEQVVKQAAKSSIDQSEKKIALKALRGKGLVGTLIFSATTFALESRSQAAEKAFTSTATEIISSPIGGVSTIAPDDMMSVRADKMERLKAAGRWKDVLPYPTIGPETRPRTHFHLVPGGKGIPLE